jgi:hypothetical protein
MSLSDYYEVSFPTGPMGMALKPADDDVSISVHRIQGHAFSAGICEGDVIYALDGRAVPPRTEDK